MKQSLFKARAQQAGKAGLGSYWGEEVCVYLGYKVPSLFCTGS